MRKHLLLAGLVAGCMALSCGTALANGISVESLTLDSYSAGHTGAAGPVSTTGNLQANKLYLIRVQGDFSAYPYNLWNQPAGSYWVTCGSPEAAPIFPSPTQPQTNEPVGADAEFVFAAVEPAFCHHTYPLTNTDFQMNLGDGFVHYEPFGFFGPPTSPTPDHAYWYVVKGQGAPASFEQIDSNTTDNYGQFHITVLGPGDSCKQGNWTGFGVFRNQGDCVSYFSTDGRNLPWMMSHRNNGPNWDFDPS